MPTISLYMYVNLSFSWFYIGYCSWDCAFWNITGSLEYRVAITDYVMNRAQVSVKLLSLSFFLFFVVFCIHTDYAVYIYMIFVRLLSLSNNLWKWQGATCLMRQRKIKNSRILVCMGPCLVGTITSRMSISSDLLILICTTFF